MTVGGRTRSIAAGRALRHWNFRLFFFGQLISLTGTWMQTVALGWLMGTLVGWDRTAVVYIGLLGMVQFLPVLILGLFGGIIADIWPRRRTLVATQTAAGVLALVLGALVYFNVVAVWHVYVLAFLLGIVNAVDMPTRQSFVMEMVGREDVVNAVGLNSAVFNSTRIIGPAIAGVLIGVVGTATCFLLNGLSYGAVVIGLLLMHGSELMTEARLAMPRSVIEVRGNLAEGLVYVRHTPLVLMTIVVVGFVSTFGMNFNVVLPIVAADVLKVGSVGYGALFAAMGAGALTSALIVAGLSRPHVRLLIVGGMLLGIGELVLAANTIFAVALVAVFCCGFGAIAVSASANSLVQLAVPGPLRGRVLSVYLTVFVGSTPIGSGMTGGIGGLFGTPVAIAVGGGVALLSELVAAAAILAGKVPSMGRGRGAPPVPTAASPAAPPAGSTD
jgi:MFS family permease